MAAFAPTFTAEQSSSGTTITITDTSPYGSGNDENYVVTDFDRQFVLVDAFDDVIDTIVMSASGLVATYDVPVNTNPWIKITFELTGVAEYEKIQKYPFQRYYDLAYINVVNYNCGCGCDDKGIDLCTVDAFYQGAQMAVPVGNGVQYQNYINSAYTLIQPAT